MAGGGFVTDRGTTYDMQSGKAKGMKRYAVGGVVRKYSKGGMAC